MSPHFLGSWLLASTRLWRDVNCVDVEQTDMWQLRARVGTCAPSPHVADTVEESQARYSCGMRGSNAVWAPAQVPELPQPATEAKLPPNLRPKL